MSVAAPLTHFVEDSQSTVRQPVRQSLTIGYFESVWPMLIIFGAFLVVTIPMGIATILNAPPIIAWAYLLILGMPHFILTFSIYCTKQNLTYFLSSRGNVTIFIVVPFCILLLFDVLHATAVGARLPTFALLFWGLIRLFDFFHLARQTFGVLQLMKSRSKVKFPVILRRWETAFTWSTVLLLMTTFLCGGHCPFFASESSAALPIAVLPLAIGKIIWLFALIGTLVTLIVSLVIMNQQQTNVASPYGVKLAMLYLLLQTIGIVCSAIYLPLYLAALAMHYVEYHVLMYPRCFHIPLDETSRVDRSFGWLRNHPMIFGSVVLLLSALATAGSYAGMGMMGRSIDTLAEPVGYLFVIAIFDGLFVIHYFVEMYIWRFSDPHFRKSLSGLYFSPLPKSNPA